MTSDGITVPDPDSFDNTMLTGLLRIAFTPSKRPVDHLIDRLQQSDAKTWFDGALAGGVIARAGDPADLLIEGDADAAMLEALKGKAKTAFGQAADADSRLRGLLHYLLVIAAGLDHHARLLSTQPRGEISAVLLELALSLPAPWNDFVAEAAMTPSRTG